MKKKAALLLTLIFSFALLSACGVTTTTLSEDFDEAELKALAQEIVTLFDEGDYAAITERAEEGIRAELSPEALEGARAELMPDAGDLISLEDGGAAGQESKGLVYGTVVVTANYENQVVTFSIAFNTDLEIAGFNIQLQ